jgi:membrane protein DedA with SNARE-associated domain
MDLFLSLPLGWAVLALFCGAMLRSNGTYWLARGLAAGARRTPLDRHLDSGVMHRAGRLINKFGPFAVTLCFLTVGLQTAVIGSAGLARMPQIRFLPAVALGSLIWAVVYATVGLAAVAAWLALLLESPAAAAVLAGVLVLGAAYLIWRKRRTAREDGSAAADRAADDDGAAGGTGGRDAGPAPGRQRP